MAFLIISSLKMKTKTTAEFFVGSPTVFANLICTWILYSFWSFGFTFASHMVWSGWHSFLVPHALQRGVSVRNTIIITFLAAIGNALSRVAVGFLTNNPFQPVTLFLFATIMNIAALLCNVYLVNYYAMLVTTCISSMAIAGKAVLSQLIVRDRASSQKYDVAFAVDQFFIGFGMILGGYLSGKEPPTTQNVN